MVGASVLGGVAARLWVGDGRLVLEGVGSSLTDSPVLTCCATDHSYTVEVDVEVEQGCKAGLLLFYNEQHSVGLWLGPKGLGHQVFHDHTPLQTP